MPTRSRDAGSECEAWRHGRAVASESEAPRIRSRSIPGTVVHGPACVIRRPGSAATGRGLAATHAPQPVGSHRYCSSRSTHAAWLRATVLRGRRFAGAVACGPGAWYLPPPGSPPGRRAVRSLQRARGDRSTLSRSPGCAGPCRASAPSRRSIRRGVPATGGGTRSCTARQRGCCRGRQRRG